MKLLLAFVSSALVAGSASAATTGATVSFINAAAFKHGDVNSCEVQINFQRRIDDTTTDYKIFSAETGKQLKDQIPYEPSQPIAVVTPTGHGQRGAYQVPGDSSMTYTPVQIDFCNGKKRYMSYYISGTDTKTKAVTKYQTFTLSKPYQFIPGGAPKLSTDVKPVSGKKNTFEASWSYKPQDDTIKVKGYYIIFGDKWGVTFGDGDVQANLGSVYVDGADKTSGQFTLKEGMDPSRIVLAVSVLDTKGALLSPTNAGEVSLIK